MLTCPELLPLETTFRTFPAKMVVIMDDVERNIESVMEDVGDGNTELQPNHFHLASHLLEKLRSATSKGVGYDPVLAKLLEFAANEFGIERQEHHDSTKLKVYSRKKAKLENAEEIACDQLIKLKSKILTTCYHSCSDHKGTMDLADIWSSMPSDLLHLVFAHLPVDEISHLRVLNKEWMQIMSKPDSEFYRHCDAVQPKMMCVLAKDSLTSNKFWVRVCDLKRGTWRRYEIIVGYPEYLIWTLACEDEGLVCFVTHVNFVSWKRDESPTIFLNVVNPLKIVLYELPPLVNMRGSIFQMKVDTTTKEFQVFVVAKRSQWSGSMWSEYHGEFTMQIFDSVTKEWSQWTPAQVFPDIVSGRLRDKQTFAIYDCANRRFVDLKAGDSSPWRGQFVGSAFYQDRIFMLRRGNDGPPNFDAGANGNKVIFYIEEWQYCQVRGDRSWLKIDVHRCNPFERPPKNPVQYFMRLFTCKGLLMVIAELTPFHAQGRFTNKRLVWLYDLSTRTWSALDLPRLPAEIKRAYPMDPYDPTHSVQLICEPRWTV